MSFSCDWCFNGDEKPDIVMRGYDKSHFINDAYKVVGEKIPYIMYYKNYKYFLEE